MNVTYRDVEESIDVAAGRIIRKYNPEEHAAFLGRLINLLCERGVINPQEAGDLFFEDWK